MSMQIPGSACLNCGRNLDATTSIYRTDHNKSLRSGDISICFYCSHIAVFGDDLRIRGLTDTEMIEIAGRKDIIAAIEAIAIIKNKRENYNGR
jgi:hypothetical protein